MRRVTRSPREYTTLADVPFLRVNGGRILDLTPFREGF
jgi:hypothetical protein